MGNKHPTITLYQAFPTTDGYSVVAVPSPNLWPRFCHAIGREDLIEAPRFETNDDRVTNSEELDAILDAESEDSTMEAKELLSEFGFDEETIACFHENDVIRRTTLSLSSVRFSPQRSRAPVLKKLIFIP